MLKLVLQRWHQIFNRRYIEQQCWSKWLSSVLEAMCNNVKEPKNHSGQYYAQQFKIKPAHNHWTNISSTSSNMRCHLTMLTNKKSLILTMLGMHSTYELHNTTLSSQQSQEDKEIYLFS